MIFINRRNGRDSSTCPALPYYLTTITTTNNNNTTTTTTISISYIFKYYKYAILNLFIYLSRIIFRYICSY